MYKNIRNFFSQLGLLLSCLGITSCAVTEDPSCDILEPTPNLMVNKIKGMSLVAAKSPIDGTPVQNLGKIGVDWIAALPYGYYQSGNPAIDSISNCPLPYCPHGPASKYAVMEAIQTAHAEGMRVMLKPQLWSDTEWIGHLSFDTELDWITFEKSYFDFIMGWVQIAISLDVEMFCVGTEIAIFAKERPQYWRNLIADIRQIYGGKLTYASNWDDYMDISFWDALDFIGVDAYFPLLEDKTPTVCNLIKAWEPYKNELSTYTAQWNKPILFTEFGYLSVDGCAYNTWELEAQIPNLTLNEMAQANAIQALVETFAPETWWEGGFQWKWYADVLSAICESDISKDYTPEGKMTSDILKQLY